MDYELIDISHLCDVGVECIPGEDPVLGEQTMRGLPFTVGSPSGDLSVNCYISLAKGDSSVTVPIGKTARNIVFAHRQLETEQATNGPIGVHIADYIIRFEDAEVVTVPHPRAIRDQRGWRPAGNIAVRCRLSLSRCDRSKRRADTPLRGTF